MESIPNCCILCKTAIDDTKATVTLTQKGCNGINSASEKRKDSINTVPGQVVHVHCRKQYCNPNVVLRDTKVLQEITSSRSTRSQNEIFQFHEHCLFCGQSARSKGKKRGYDVFQVRTMDFMNTILDICSKRNDVWADQVRTRVEFANDLPARDAVYHQTCNVNFRTHKEIPKCFQVDQGNKKSQSRGRTPDLEAGIAFSKAIEYLKHNDDEQITITDLVNKMKEVCGEKAYSMQYTKQKLEEYFGDDVIITEINGKQNVVTLRRTASSLLHEFYCQNKSENTDNEKLKIIKTAAKLIKSDIKSVNNSRQFYPNPHDISSVDKNKQFLPESLVQLLDEIFSEKDADIKKCSIGQAIMQAARPRVMLAPLQLSLAVQLHHHFASKYLIDVLNSLGFCVSYPEVQMFETSAAVSNRTDINGFQNDMFIQYAADNVDHNLRTIDGHNTFHGMGMIACVTPGNFGNKSIKRQVVTADDLLAAGRIDISFYKQQTLRQPITFSELKRLSLSDKFSKVTFLAHLTWPLRKPGPEWSGLMQMIGKGHYPGKSSFVFLPMIDMEPTDMSCIHTTLKYISNHAYQYNQTAIITFDQPLYWKAMTIISNETDNSLFGSIVVRLGGFHCIMSYIGCIGQLMSGSGLSDLLETVYASNTISHMMSGKSVSRAIRGHSLATKALNILLMSQCSESLVAPFVNEIINTEVTDTFQELHDVRMTELVDLYEKVISCEIGVEVVNDNIVLHDMYRDLNTLKHRLVRYPTAELWIQYIEMFEILRRFIISERTGNWELSLEAMCEMLPYFAAAGHNLYLKSVYLYIQCMQDLHVTHPNVHKAFLDGYHVVRRSDRYWGGLSIDLVIEQVLMRSIKTTGGMTRGKGLSECQRAQWLLSIPSCVEINNAMQTFCGKEFCTSPQHKDFGKSRAERDFKDTRIFLSFLSERNPFREDSLLFNIETGITSDSKVNAHKAKSVGEKVVTSMVGQNAFDISFKKSEKAITLDAAQQVKIDNETVKIDPQLLFQRLSAAAQRFIEDIPSVFAYELCSVPSCLFDTSGLIRKSQKSVLADAIWALGDCGSVDTIDMTECMFVLDGGSLLHHIPRKRGMLFSEICDSYIHYISANYKRALVVFDGYQLGSTTKDSAHVRRTHGKTSAKVYFTKSTPFSTRKDKFLSNSENKQNFIFMLGEELEKKSYDVVHAQSDADVLIVKSALEIAEASNVVIIGEDTDLLVLLLYHIRPNHKNVYFKSAPKQKASNKLKVWDINKTKEVLGQTYSHVLPVIHAVTGCDTTSQLFGLSKVTALKKFRSNDQLVTLAKVFLTPASNEDIVMYGEHILVILFGGLPVEGLDMLRFRKFSNKVMSSSSQVQVQSLPPTRAAAKYHSLRAFYQVQEWIGAGNNLLPNEWGWKITTNGLIPIKTDLPAAPNALLNMVRCNCKLGCDNQRCTCRKNGLECSSGCGECRGVSCTNSVRLADSDSDTE